MNLRILFSIFILLFIKTVSFSQIFSLKEMILLNNKSYDEFDTYVTKKNYEFYNTEDDGICEKHSYTLNRDSYSDKATYWISISKYYATGTESKSTVTWVTKYLKHYLSFKEQLKASSYKVQKTDTYKGALYTVYRKGKIEVTLFSVNSENEMGGKITSYEISVDILR